MPESSDVKKLDRAAEWQKIRIKSYQSLIFPTLSVLLAYYFSPKYVRHLYLSPFTSPKRNLLAWYFTYDYFKTWFICEFFLNLLKFLIYVVFCKISIGDYKRIIGRRDNWSEKDIEYFNGKYNVYKKDKNSRDKRILIKNNIKRLDALNRRSGHLCMNFLRIWFFVFSVPTPELRLQTAVLQWPIMFLLKKSAEFSNNIVANSIFQGARIRDGQYARFNPIIGCYWTYCSRIIMMTLLINWGNADGFSPTIIEPFQHKIILCMAMQPLIWGDTFGEIIGSFFGKREFQVWGIGEKSSNKKTVEGTIAVFVASFISLLVTYNYMGGEQVYNLIFSVNKYLVFAVNASSPQKRPKLQKPPNSNELVIQILFSDGCFELGVRGYV